MLFFPTSEYMKQALDCCNDKYSELYSRIHQVQVTLLYCDQKSQGKIHKRTLELLYPLKKTSAQDDLREKTFPQIGGDFSRNLGLGYFFTNHDTAKYSTPLYHHLHNPDFQFCCTIQGWKPPLRFSQNQNGSLAKSLGSRKFLLWGLQMGTLTLYFSTLTKSDIFFHILVNPFLSHFLLIRWNGLALVSI